MQTFFKPDEILNHISTLTDEQWKQLFDLLPRIKETDDFGRHVVGEMISENVGVFPYFINSEVMSEFIRVAYRLQLVLNYPWMDWTEGRNILQHTANPDFTKFDIVELCKLITMMVRADRFVDGYLSNQFREGNVAALISALENKISKRLIPDDETDTIYLTDALEKQHPTFFKSLTGLLRKKKVTYKMITGATNIWCRDYLPVQAGKDRFIKFNYCGEEDFTSLIPQEILAKTIFSDILLDGGNVIKGKYSVIITDKIIKDNKNYSRSKLIKQLQNLFLVDNIIIIPHLPYDEFGHADGMIRYCTPGTWFVNDYTHTQQSENFRRKFDRCMKTNFLTTTRLPYREVERKNTDGVQGAIGCYMNFLRTKDIAIVPSFPELGKLNDEILEMIRKHFAAEQLNCTEVADEGGVLNCVTWTMKT